MCTGIIIPSGPVQFLGNRHLDLDQFLAGYIGCAIYIHFDRLEQLLGEFQHKRTVCRELIHMDVPAIVATTRRCIAWPN